MNFMNKLTASEKRTIRYGAALVAIVLALLIGLKLCHFFGGLRSHYRVMVTQARQLRVDAKMEKDEAAIVKKMMTDFHLDPATLTTNSAVADANAAIQTAARNGGIAVEAIRETAGGTTPKELATIQFQGAGQPAAVVMLIRQLPLLGSPLVIRSLQLTADPMRPGQVKINVTLSVLNFDEWKKGGAPNA